MADGHDSGGVQVDGAQRGAARRMVCLMPLVLLAVVAAFALMRAPAQSAPASGTVTVRTDVATVNGALTLNNLRFSDAMAAVTAAHGTSNLTIAFTAGTTTTITGLPEFTAARYEFFLTNDGPDDEQPRLVIRGYGAEVFGEPADVIITAKWRNDTDDFRPQLAVLLRFDSLDLQKLNTGLQFPIAAENVIVGVGTAFAADGTTPIDQPMVASRLDPGNATKFFEDGTGAVIDPFRVANRGVTVAATVSGGSLVDGARALGSVDKIALLGSVGDTGVLKNGKAVTGVTLTGKVTTVTPTSLKDGGVTLGGEWTVGFVNRGDSWDAELAGSAKLNVGGGDVTISAKARYTTVAGGQWTLEAGVANDLTGVFGQQWLTLKSGTLSAVFNPNGTTLVSLQAGMTVGPVSGSAKVTFGRTNNVPTAGLSLQVAGEYSVRDIVAAIGQTTPDTSWDTIIKQVDFQVTAASGPSVGTSMIVALSGQGTVLERPASAPCGAFTGVEASLLFRFESTGGKATFLAAAGLPTPGTDPSLTIKQLDCSALFDWTLPRLFVTATNAEIKTNFANLDGPTSQFFRPLKCVTLTTGCPIDLEVGQGVTVGGTVKLDGAVGNALGDLGIGTTGVIRFSGTLPLMGNAATAKLRIELPTIASDSPDTLIKQGNILLDAEGGPTGIKVKLSGNAVFRMERIDQATCPAQDAKRFSATKGSRCYDEVLFGVSAAIEATTGPPPGASFVLSATVANWQQPFGITWLNIKQVAMDLTIEAKATGAPNVSVVIGAQLALGNAGEKDLVLTVGVGVTAAPPSVQLTALTVGSSAGFSFREVTEWLVPDVSPTALAAIPDLSLKNLWLAYATSDNANLCARAGLYISAELHLNAETGTTGLTPGCNKNGFLAASCSPGSPSCLAGIQLSVDRDGLVASGYITPFETGPINFDGLAIDIVVKPLEQRFSFVSGATLYDPFLFELPERPLPIWASAYLRIELSQRLGKLSAELNGCVIIGGQTPAAKDCPGADTALAKLGVVGELSFNVLDGKDFVKNAKAELQFVAESEGMKQLADELNSKLRPVIAEVAKVFDDTSQTLSSWWVSSGQDRCKILVTPSCTALTLVDPAGSQAQTYINERIQATDDLIRNNFGLNVWCFVSRGGFGLQSCLDGYRRLAQEQNSEFIRTQGGAVYIAIHGVNGDGSKPVFVIASDILVPATRFTYPQTGVAPCAPGGSLDGNKICAAGPYQPMDLSEIRGQVAYDTVAAIDPELAAYLDKYVTPNIAGRQFGDMLVAEAGVVAAQEASVDAAGFLQTLQTLGARVDPAAPLSICEASIRYIVNGEGGAVEPLELLVRTDAYGARVTPKVDISGGSVDLAGLGEAVLGDILAGPLAELGCPEPVSTPGLTIDVIASSVQEGSPLTVAGTAAAGAPLTIVWGDESSTDVFADESGAWMSVHVYADGPAVRVVEVGSGGATASRIVNVTNVRPSITNLAVPSSVEEGRPLTLVATLMEPGASDLLTAVVDWGDGAVSTIDLGLARSLPLAHTYVDDDPTGTPQDTYTIVVVVTDDDGGRVTRTTQIDVVNVAPQMSDVIVSADGAELPRDLEGRWEIPEGQTVEVTGVVTDPGRLDSQRLQIAWGDGDFTPVAAQQDPADATKWTFQAAKAFADDDPTGTPRDGVVLRVFLADDDMSFKDGDADNLVEVDLVVVDVAPEVASSTSTATVQYSDRLSAITVSASDVSGTLTDGVRSEILSVTTQYRLGDQAWQHGLPRNLTIRATGCPVTAARQTCGWVIEGQADVAPGTYIVEVTVTDDDTVSSNVTLNLVVAPEGASVTYIGPRIVSSPRAADGSVVVEFRAVVRDSSIVPAATDDTAGDITKATVTFVDRLTGSPLCTSAVSPVFVGDTTTGVASCTAPLLTVGAGPWTSQVGTIVGGWYAQDARADDVAVTARRLASIDLHGNHFVMAARGAGVLAPATGTRVTIGINHLGFSNGRAVGGSADMVFTSAGRTYRAVVTSVDTLGVISTGPDSQRVDLDARVTVSDITDARRPVVIARDVRLQLRYVDWTKSATPDLMSFAIWSADGPMLAGVQWDGTQMNAAVLAGGQVIVASSLPTSGRAR